MTVIKNTKLRNTLRLIIPYLLIPLVVVGGAVVFRAKRYLWISTAVASLSLLLFASGFEKKKTGTRRLVIVSIMIALSVAGRFIPLFKPITALTVLTAVYLGGEAGFLTGALSALISNFWFGQGPWTPFQMFAWGIIGLIAGALSKPLEQNRCLLVLYGVLAGIVYSNIMDVWTVLWYDGSLNLQLYLAALITALPSTALYAASNAVFLWLLAKPIGDKLRRLRIKYGV